MNTLTKEDLRKLDALIVEHVFGGSYRTSTGNVVEKALLCVYEGTGIRENRRGTISEFCKKCGNPYGYHDCYPAYTAAAEAARDIRTQMLSSGRVVKIELHRTNVDWAECAAIDLKGGYDWAYAETEELATCLCALKVYGVGCP